MSLAEELDCVKMKLVKLSVVVLGCCDTPGPEGVLHVWQVLTMTPRLNYHSNVFFTDGHTQNNADWMKMISQSDTISHSLIRLQRLFCFLEF